MTTGDESVMSGTARQVSKHKNRAHLLECATEAIYRFGYRGTTIANIQQLSGLSRGMINLHFQSKENLLLAVAENLASRYTEHWETAARNDDLAAAERLMGHFHADMSPEVLNERDVSVWFSLRAEVSSRPEYRTYLDSHEKNFHGNLIEICSALKQEGRYEQVNPALAANCILALLEGFWTDFHLHPAEFNRAQAEETFRYLAKSFFPDHF